MQRMNTAIKDWLSFRVFNFVHRNNLVYNTCWEDPRLDRAALNIGPDDCVLAITSAGCNALDYVLAGAKHVFAVDMNPRQNALLELKIAAIRELDYESFFEMFGRGRMDDMHAIYRRQLRSQLSSWAKEYWDRRIKFFCHPRRSFYFRGSAGSFARMINFYVDHVCHVRSPIERILDAESLAEQQQIYYHEIEDRFWSPALKFAMDRDTTLSLVGVPKAQRRQVERQYRGGIVQFIQDCVEAVFAQLPLRDNYFWRVYLTGTYTPQCCPEYLTKAGFERLQRGFVDRLSIHTNSVQSFLEQSDCPISRFVLLDHMDWLSDRFFPLLELEWQAIFERAAPGARAIWRSGGLRTDYLDRVHIRRRGDICRLNDRLHFHQQLSADLHSQDRVHTYGSFYIADIVN